MRYIASIANILILVFIVFLIFENVYSTWLWLAFILWLLFHALKVHLWIVDCRANEGETVVLTGASSGIGKEIAKQMASYGYNLVLVSRTMAQHTSFAAELVKMAKNNSSTITVELVALDLVDPRAPNELYTHCKRKNIRVDYLINCAGIALYDTIIDTDETRTNEIINLNVCSTTKLTQLFIRDMIARKRGGVLNIGSVVGEAPAPKFAIYAATKSYIHNFTSALWWECRGTGVKVSLCSPGGTETNFMNVSKFKNSLYYLIGTTKNVKAVADVAIKGLMNDELVTVPGLWNEILLGVSMNCPKIVNLFVVWCLNKKIGG